jgi:hypothetical protein
LGATLLYVITDQQPAELMTDDLQLDFGKISNISTEFEVWIRKMLASASFSRFEAIKSHRSLANPCRCACGII